MDPDQLDLVFGNAAPPVKQQPEQQQTQAAPPSNNDPWGVAATPALPSQQAAPIPVSVSTPVETTNPAADPSNPAETTGITIAPISTGSGSAADDDDRFINDPALKEIKAKFSGKWKLVRSDPYDEFLKFIGVGLMTRKLANTSGLIQQIFIKDNNVNIHFHSTFYNQIYRLRLNESQEVLINKIPQHVFCNYEKERIVLQMTSTSQGFSRTFAEERHISDLKELVVIYTSGNKSCRRYFERIVEVPSGPDV